MDKEAVERGAPVTEEMIVAGARSLIDGQENRPGSSWAEEAKLCYQAMHALAQQPAAQTAPYAYDVTCADGESEMVCAAYMERHGKDMDYVSRVPLYAALPAQAAGLTDDEIERLISRFIGNVAPGLRNDCRELVREVLSRAAPSGEPIHQMRKADGSWIDQTEASYRYNLSYGHAVRIVYAAPQPSAQWATEEARGGEHG